MKKILFLFCFIFFFSCEQFEDLENPCSGNIPENINLESVPNSFFFSWEIIRSLWVSEGVKTSEEVYKKLNSDGDRELEREYFRHIRDENSLYSNSGGYKGYINAKHKQGHLTAPLSKYLINFHSDFLAFLKVEQPELSELEEFLNQKNNEIYQIQNLCEGEKFKASYFNRLILGYSKFHYRYNSPGFKTRACQGFWEHLGCIAVGTVVGVVSTAVNTTTNYLVLIDKNVPPTLPDPPADQLAAGIGLITGVIEGVRAGVFCCETDLFGTDNYCLPPTGAWAEAVDCDNFIIRVTGTAGQNSAPVNRFIWRNENVDPPNAETAVPFLRVRAEDSNLVSTFSITTFCTDSEGEDINTFDASLQLSDLTQEEVRFLYLNPPPLTVQLSSQSVFELQYTTGNSKDRVALSWNVSPFGAATLNHLDRFRTAVTFHTVGEVNISVNTTNICTGEIETMTTTTIVTN